MGTMASPPTCRLLLREILKVGLPTLPVEGLYFISYLYLCSGFCYDVCSCRSPSY